MGINIISPFMKSQTYKSDKYEDTSNKLILNGGLIMYVAVVLNKLH